MDLFLKNNKASITCPQCAQKLTFSWNLDVIKEVECFDCHFKFRLVPERVWRGYAGNIIKSSSFEIWK